MLIGLVAGEGEGERESHSKVGTLLGPTKIKKVNKIKKISFIFHPPLAFSHSGR